ncbi:MAG: hypothetical protein MJZ93_00730 [Paludibacteraceae bacterium]|nr:hypothetical protein [Paludibacteraceae bacterium]
MKKSCLIVAMFLIVGYANAQWKEKSNVRWWKNAESWRFEFRAERSCFHRGKGIYDTHYTDGVAGTSYRLIGIENPIYQNNSNQRRSPYVMEGNAVFGREKATIRVGSNTGKVRKITESEVVRNHRHLINSEVSNSRGHDYMYYGGYAGTTDYGRRVKPTGTPANAVSTYGEVSIKNSSLKNSQSIENDEIGSKQTNLDDADVNGGGYGFGELPHDDAPIGGGILTLLLLITLHGLKKMRNK